MKLRFVDSVQTGRNEPWRYFVGMMTILGCWFGGIVLALALWQSWPESGLNEVSAPFESSELGATTGATTTAIAQALIATYSLNHLPFLCLGLGVLGVVPVLHQRHPLTLISPDKTFAYRRFGIGFGTWFGIAIAQTILEYWQQPDAFTRNFQFSQWVFFLPVAIVLTPLQTSVEELFFRGYLLQAMGLIIRQPLLLCLAASVPFALVHWVNPEMQRDGFWMGLAYFVMAVFLTGITLKDGRLELALGVHAANNLFIVLGVNTHDSVLQTPALIVQTIPTHPPLTVLLLLLGCGAFYGFIFKQRLFPK